MSRRRTSIISNTGIVKLIDFGVAKAASSSNQTQVGTVKGKFSYMAPEYLSGKRSTCASICGPSARWRTSCSRRARCSTRDDDFEVIDSVKSAPISPPSRLNAEVPPELDAVVLTALQRDPARRWQIRRRRCAPRSPTSPRSCRPSSRRRSSIAVGRLRVLAEAAARRQRSLAADRAAREPEPTVRQDQGPPIGTHHRQDHAASPPR